MTAIRAFTSGGLTLAILLVAMSVPRTATAQNTTLRLLEQIVGRLDSMGNVSHSWSHLLPPGERFVVLADFNDEAVLDRNTGLVWEKSPLNAVVQWGGARYSCADRAIGNQYAWRLPSFAELASLIDRSGGSSGPTLPLGHPFAGVQPAGYWSASTNAVNTANAWIVDFAYGRVISTAKTDTQRIWCVRGGMNADQY